MIRIPTGAQPQTAQQWRSAYNEFNALGLRDGNYLSHPADWANIKRGNLVNFEPTEFMGCRVFTSTLADAIYFATEEELKEIIWGLFVKTQ